MASLPQNLTLDAMQQRWASILSPFISDPMNQGQLLANISLITGDNTINTLLAKKQQGWVITDITAAAIVYRSKPFNATTLTLNASAPCVVSLLVY